ncbi:Peroxisome chaperone and import receptor [Pseudocyphellaria aurata]|nr:Peroxisome chaperone and import receptor [Pseudocyphellaria aurata]
MDERPNQTTVKNMPKGPTDSTGPQTTAGAAPDPDEDDLDDLDDLLDEFSTAKLESAQDTLQPSSSGQLQEGSHGADSSDAAAAEFSRQLQEQMAALMSDADESPEMRREIEVMMQELAAATDLGGAGDPAAEASSTTEQPFQETIRKTMERMQASAQQPAQAEASEESDDILAQMLKEMQSSGADGAANEEDFSKMLLGMMEQLTNKDILFEPMQELHEKLPKWIDRNKNSIKPEDLKRYLEQQRVVGEIVGKFNEKGYSDSNPADREYIVERMQQMQAAGSPPADLVGDLSATQEALGDLDPDCAQQ